MTWCAEYTYNAQGKETSKTSYGLNGNVLDCTGKTTTIYNDKGLVTSLIGYTCANGNFTYSYKDTYTYNSDGQVKVFTRYFWQNGAWTSVSKYEYMYYSDGKLKTDTRYSRKNGTWVVNLKIEYTYDDNGNTTSTDYALFSSNNVIRSHNKYTSTFDKDNHILYSGNYSMENGQWELYQYTLFFYGSPSVINSLPLQLYQQTRKTLKNGKIIIHHNNVTYDLNGIETKDLYIK